MRMYVKKKYMIRIRYSAKAEHWITCGITNSEWETSNLSDTTSAKMESYSLVIKVCD